MEKNEYTPEQKQKDVQIVRDCINKNFTIARQNLANQAARLVQKYHGGKTKVSTRHFDNPVELVAEPYVPPKQKDLTFHRLHVKITTADEVKDYLASETPKEILPLNAMHEILEELVKQLES